MYPSVELSVHIRRTDKIGTEASFHSLEEYMVHVEQYYKLKELSEKVDKKRIYLATDEWTLFSEIRRKYVQLFCKSTLRRTHARFPQVSRVRDSWRRIDIQNRVARQTLFRPIVERYHHGHTFFIALRPFGLYFFVAGR